MEDDLFKLGLKAIFQNSKSKILFVRTSSERRDKAHDYWDLPGGKIQKGETIEEALKREVFEEIGVDKFDMGDLCAVDISKLRKFTDEQDHGLILFAYLCQGDIKQISISDEHSEFGWFDAEEIANSLLTKYNESFIEKLKELKNAS